jgi:hypothetical protein
MSGDQAPQWLQDALTLQSQQLAALAAQHTEAMATMTTRLLELEGRTVPESDNLQVPLTTPGTRSPASSDYQAGPAVRKPKPSLPNPEKFDGENLTLYPQFEGILKAKLQIDGPAIGGEVEQVWYSFGRLSGTAAARIYPWVSYAQKQGQFTTDALFGQMKTAFSDPRARQKALSELNRTKQGSRPFREFLSEFNRLILEAEGWGWDHEVKKGYLKAAISIKLITGFVGKDEEETYEGYCSQLRMVSDQLTEVADLTARRTNWRRQHTSQARFPEPGSGDPNIPQTPAPPETMEWEPTAGAAAVRTKEPRWASPEEVERRKNEGLCLRCGQDGHRVRDCRTKLKHPKPVKVAAVKKGPQVQEAESEDSDSGKE